MKKITLICVFLLCCGGFASASVITPSKILSPVLIVDSSSATDIISVADTGSIFDLNIWIDFTKSGDWINSLGNPTGGGFTFNSEIVFDLTGPDATSVSLVAAGDFSGQSGSVRTTFTFDDEAATAAAGLSSLVDGTYQPNGLLSAFDGKSVTGDWSLYFADTVGLDPLSLNAWGMEIDTSAPVPEPATMVLFGLGLLGLAGVSRRKN